MNEVGGLLLAAGAGRRFGMPKSLVRFEGQLLVQRGVELLQAGGCRPVVAVLGAEAERVLAEADLGPAEAVVNPGWRTGMGSSLRYGLAALEGRCEAVVVALVDQPLIGPESVRRVVEAWRAGARAAVACYDGQPRNPVLLDASLWDEASTSEASDAGAREWLRTHPDLVTLVACDGTGSPADVDTPEDLVALTGSSTGFAAWDRGSS